MFVYPFPYGRNQNNMKTWTTHEEYPTTVDGVAVRKIFVGNLPLKATSQELINKFQRYGEVQNVTIVPPTANRPNCFGFVTFFTPQVALKAMSNKNLFLRGHKLYISPADSWHQPVELPNGQINWDIRPNYKQRNNEQPENEEEEEEEGDVEEQPVVYNEVATCPISKLNDDCLDLIFSHLYLCERVVVGQVCKRWRKINENLWHRMRKLDFSSSFSMGVPTTKRLQLYLSLCPNVTSIDLSKAESNIEAEALVIIAKSCKSLEELTIRNIPIRRRSLALLAQNCPNLSAFYMNMCPKYHDSEMISLVKKCKKLKRIGLKYSSGLSGNWLRFLDCPLESLSLEMYELNPDILLQGIIKVSSTLKELSFISCPSLRNKDIEAIGEFVPNLTFLTLAGVSILLMSCSNTFSVSKFKNLKRLDLEQNSIVSDEFMMSLVENCQSLIHLNLSGSDFGCRLTEKGLILVADLLQLTHLRIACHVVLNDTILKAISKKLKALKHLDIMGCNSITDKGCIDIINNCFELESIDVSSCSQITNETIQAAIRLLENGRTRKLNIIAGGTNVDPEVLLIKPEIRPYLNIDLQTSIFSYVEDFYDSDYDNSDFSIDDFSIFDRSCFYDFYSDAEDSDIDILPPVDIWMY